MLVLRNLSAIKGRTGYLMRMNENFMDKYLISLIVKKPFI